MSLAPRTVFVLRLNNAYIAYLAEYCSYDGNNVTVYNAIREKTYFIWHDICSANTQLREYPVDRYVWSFLNSVYNCVQ